MYNAIIPFSGQHTKQPQSQYDLKSFSRIHVTNDTSKTWLKDKNVCLANTYVHPLIITLLNYIN